MLRNGITTAMVSYYCHQNQGNVCDKMVIKAALDTGIRLYFGRMNYDIVNTTAYAEKIASQKRYYESVEVAEENFLQLQEEIRSPWIVVAPAIHSIHASTREAIINSINLGEEYHKYVQFHLSEDQQDVDLSLNWYKLRPLKFLDDLWQQGLVKSLEHLFLSDCIWIDDAERGIIRKHRMKVVLNPRMNKQIKAGEAYLPALLAQKIDLYLGTDGEASNDDLSISGERQFLKARYPLLSPELIDNIGEVPLVFGDGCLGGLLPGNYCDLKVTRTRDNTITDVFVGGKRVVRQGEFTMLKTADIEERLKGWCEKANADNYRNLL
jgi:5-methylthioadenosine/S-adenosylhomocysteine deaminase